MIRKKGDKFIVVSKAGKPMGTYATKAAAQKRLNQVEAFKHMKEKK
jgi:hypothetical protein